MKFSDLKIGMRVKFTYDIYMDTVYANHNGREGVVHYLRIGQPGVDDMVIVKEDVVDYLYLGVNYAELGLTQVHDKAGNPPNRPLTIDTIKVGMRVKCIVHLFTKHCGDSNTGVVDSVDPVSGNAMVIFEQGIHAGAPYEWSPGYLSQTDAHEMIPMPDVPCRNATCGKMVSPMDKKCWWCMLPVKP